MLPLILGLVVASTLAVIGLMHLLWALGVTFPAANEQELARMVVGRRGITRMPSTAAILFVTAGIFAAAGLALVLGRVVDLHVSKWIQAPAGALAGLIFAGRGIVGILPSFEQAAPEQPFLKLNRRFYSPLSFLIGLGFILLTLSLPYWTWRLGLMH